MRDSALKKLKDKWMKIFLVLFLSIAPFFANADSPPYKYECFAKIAQDWYFKVPPKEKIIPPTGFYSKTPIFFLTQENYSEGIRLTNKDFTLFEGAKETLKDSSFEKPFYIDIDIKGAPKNEFEWSSLVLTTNLVFNVPGAKQKIGLRTVDAAKDRPEKLSTLLEVRMYDNLKKIGPLYLLVSCQDLLIGDLTNPNAKLY